MGQPRLVDDVEGAIQQDNLLCNQPESRPEQMPVSNGRTGGAYIDDDHMLDWSEPEDDEEEDEGDMDEVYFEDSRVEDEDWDMTERGSQ